MAIKNKIKILSPSVGYNLAAETYDQKENYLNSFEQGKVLPLLGNLSNQAVLDVGAGTGRLSLLLSSAGAQVTAVDVSAKMLQILRQKNSHIVTITGEAEDLSFADNTFDVITAVFLIVHLKNPTRFFDEVYRVLKPGGRFLCTNINQKESPLVRTKTGLIKIDSYYHRPEKIRKILLDLAFTFLKEEIIREKNVWVNQIILVQK